MVTFAVSDALRTRKSWLPAASPRMIELRIVTLRARTSTEPRMSRPLMTVPGVVMTRLPRCTRSAVPAGTPVLSGPGIDCVTAAARSTVAGAAVAAVAGSRVAPRATTDVATASRSERRRVAEPRITAGAMGSRAIGMREPLVTARQSRRVGNGPASAMAW
jgi:hypothetical protein